MRTLQPKRLGHWANHSYSRRSCKKDITGFVGWPRIVELAGKFKSSKARRDRALYSATFLTGGRIGEVLLLKNDNFIIDLDEVTVTRMPLFKRYEKLAEFLEWVDEKPGNKLARLFKLDEERDKFYRKRYETRKEETFRSDFSFPKQEPLANLLVEWVENAKYYLFPGYSNSQLSYIRAYQILTSIGIYPHWLRGQRASCIVSFYGLIMEEMMEWFGWEELSTARDYARFGKKTLVSKMSSRQYPAKALEIEQSFVKQ